MKSDFCNYTCINFETSEFFYTDIFQQVYASVGQQPTRPVWFCHQWSSGWHDRIHASFYCRAWKDGPTVFHNQCDVAPKNWMVQTRKVWRKWLIWSLLKLLYHFRTIEVPDLDWDKKFHKIAETCSGFSGREIAKLAISWQVTVTLICMATH